MNRPHLIAAEIQYTGEHAVVVPENSSAQVLVINYVAAEILSKCDGIATIDTIADHIAMKFGVDRGRVRNDVIQLVEAVREIGLMRHGE